MGEPCQKKIDIYIENDYHYCNSDLWVFPYLIKVIKETQMVDKYNESSQLRVRLAILESQLKMANNRIKHLESINKEERTLTPSSQAK